MVAGICFYSDTSNWVLLAVGVPIYPEGVQWSSGLGFVQV